MAVPDFQTLMLPLLETAKAGGSTVQECAPKIADRFELTADDLAEMLPSGRQPTFINRLHWARTYLAKAGLLAMIRRGVFEPSPEGLRVLQSQPDRIDMRYLEQFAAYRAWRSAEGGTSEPSRQQPAATETGVGTPEETIASAVAEIEASLADDLLTRLMQGSPTFFEDAVVGLLVAMGYGQGRDGAGQRIGRSGDGGIDGIINEDALGLDAVYVQAKRYSPDIKVGRPAIQQFVGSLTGEGATKGVFVTTSSFSGDARSYVERVAQRIVLIDGQTLAKLMIQHNVGVRPVRQIVLSEVDENFFSED